MAATALRTRKKPHPLISTVPYFLSRRSPFCLRRFCSEPRGSLNFQPPPSDPEPSPSILVPGRKILDTFREEFEVGSRTVSIETGKIASFANGSVVFAMEETNVVSTVASSKTNGSRDFLPLTVKSLAEEPIEAVFTDSTYGKFEQGEALDKITQVVKEKLEEECDEDSLKVLPKTVDTVRKKVVRGRIIEKGLRVDGRQLDEVRPLYCEAGTYPILHGSAIFSRGDTQVLCTVTLGAPSDAQCLDSIVGPPTKRFMLHYSFPPFSINEVGKRGGLNRREVGHGTLAEKALLAVLPPEDEFPYTVRINSEVMASDGSTSMASVCGAMVGWQRCMQSVLRHAASAVNQQTRAAPYNTFTSSSQLLGGQLAGLRRVSDLSSKRISGPFYRYLQYSGFLSSRGLSAEDNNMEPISSPLTPLLGDGKTKSKDASSKPSPKKVNLVAKLVRGMRVEDALLQLQVTVKRAAKTVYQVIHSARANATHNHGLDADRLLVAEAFVGKGLYLKRLSYHAKGRSGIMVRPRCRLTVVVREITAEEEAKIAKLRVSNYKKLTRRERQLVPHQLIETTPRWGQKRKDNSATTA